MLWEILSLNDRADSTPVCHGSAMSELAKRPSRAARACRAQAISETAKGLGWVDFSRLPIVNISAG
jgi:hypothetical protein